MRAPLFALPALLGVSLAVAVAATPEPEVTAAGSGPMRTLQVAPAVGTKQVSPFVMSMTTTTQVMGQQVAMTLPEIRATTSVEVTGREDSQWTAAYRYDAVEVSGAKGMAQMVAQQMKQSLAGLEGSMTVTDRGQTVTVADEALQALGDGADGFDLAQWTAPLPATPVGVGASWTVKQVEMTPQGLEVDQTIVYTVAGFDGEAIVLDLSLSSTAKPGTLTIQQGAKQVELEVASMTSTGSGSLTLLPTRPLPKTATMTLKITQDMSVQGQPVQQTTDMTMKIGEAAAK